jgi:hypothetical protein
MAKEYFHSFCQEHFHITKTHVQHNTLWEVFALDPDDGTTWPSEQDLPQWEGYSFRGVTKPQTCKYNVPIGQKLMTYHPAKIRTKKSEQQLQERKGD